MTDRSEVIEPWVGLAELSAMTDIQDEDLLNDARRMSSDVLYNFTGRKWAGVGSDTVRPCVQGCGAPGSWAGMLGAWGITSGRFLTAGTAGSDALDSSRPWPASASCGCGWISEFVFPARNVVAITQVLLDGVVLDPSTYRLDDADAIPKLVRVDGNVWPMCQNLLLDTTEEGTWGIEYTFGQLPPTGGVKACKSLSAQLAYATMPDAVKDGRCRLPKRVTSVVRQGVTLALIDPLTLFADGNTGIAEVDLWVNSIRYGDQHEAAQVIDPLRSRRVRRTG